MYGMVNLGIQKFITENHGANVWWEIRANAGIGDTEFESMLTYNDASTYRLVEAISEKLDMPQDEVLRIFGEYWIEYAGDTPLGRIIDFSGNSFIEVLDSLDEMHERFQATMPHLRPPSFEVVELSERTFLLHYQSERQGLTPMVIGLLHGLAQRQGERITVSLVARKSEGAHHDIFRIERLDKARLARAG
jgi:hypothetical protein